MDGGCRALSTTATVEDLLRRLAPQVVGVLARRSGDFTTAEDAVQEALLAAHTTWLRDGIPDAPRAWLLTTASRRLVDAQRSDAARRRREREWVAAEPSDATVVQHDDTLAVLLLCCHPVLTPASAVALTLRAVGGLTTAEVAAAYAVPESTMATRISRAKRQVRDSGEPFALPAPDAVHERVAQVLTVLYLVYNEGYVATSGPQLTRTDLSAEAIRLARMAHRLLPADAGGDRAPRPAAPARRAPPGAAHGIRRGRAPRRAGPLALGPRPRRGGDGAARLHPRGWATRDVPGAGRDRRGARPGAAGAGHRLAAGARRSTALLEEVAPSPFVTLAKAVALAEADGPDAAAPLVDEVAAPAR